MPTDEEWTTLENYVGGVKTAGNKLKSTTGWNVDSNGTFSGSLGSDWDEDGNGTDEYGFSALPGGYGYSRLDRYNNETYEFSFTDVGDNGGWWSATGITRHMAYTTENVGVRELGDYANVDISMYSVRCVAD